jgi:hypothetical protein
MLLEKYMMSVGFANHGQTFVGARHQHFQIYAGLTEKDMSALRQIEEMIPKTFVDEDFGDDDPTRHLELGFDDDA